MKEISSPIEISPSLSSLQVLDKRIGIKGEDDSNNSHRKNNEPRRSKQEVIDVDSSKTHQWTITVIRWDWTDLDSLLSLCKVNDKILFTIEVSRIHAYDK